MSGCAATPVSDPAVSCLGKELEVLTGMDSYQCAINRSAITAIGIPFKMLDLITPKQFRAVPEDFKEDGLAAALLIEERPEAYLIRIFENDNSIVNSLQTYSKTYRQIPRIRAYSCYKSNDHVVCNLCAYLNPLSVQCEFFGQGAFNQKYQRIDVPYWLGYSKNVSKRPFREKQLDFNEEQIPLKSSSRLE